MPINTAEIIAIANKLKKSEEEVYIYDEESLRGIDPRISEVLFSEEEFYRIFDELKLESKVEKSHKFLAIQELEVQEIIVAEQYNPIEQLKEKIRKNPKKNWIPTSGDGDIETNKEDARMFFLQLVLLDLYDHNKIIGSEIENNEEVAKNNLQDSQNEANKDVLTNQDLWLWVEFNGLKEEGQIPQGYEYKAFLGLVRKLIEKAVTEEAVTHDIREESSIEKIVAAVSIEKIVKEAQKEAAAILIQKTARGNIARALKTKKEAAATLIQKTFRGHIARAGALEETKPERIKMQEEDHLARSARDSEKTKAEKDKELEGEGEGGDHVIGASSQSDELVEVDNNSVKALSGEGVDEGGRGDGDRHDALEEGGDYAIIKKPVEIKGSNNSLSLHDDKEEVGDDDDSVSESLINTELKYFRDKDSSSEESDNEREQGGDHSGNKKSYNFAADEVGGSGPNNEINEGGQEEIDSRDDEPFDEDEDDHESLKKLDFLNLEPREIDYQYLEDNHYVSSRYESENYLIPEITGTKDETNFLKGKVLQYPSGLPVSYYENLNDFSQDADKAAEKEWNEDDNRLLSSIAYIDDKKIGPKYCVVNASVRGVTKIFISDKEFNKIKIEADVFFLKKFDSNPNPTSDLKLEDWPKTTPEAEELMRSVSQEFSKKIAQDVEKSIGNEVINGLDTLEVESIAEDFVKTHLGKNSFRKEVSGEDAGDLKGEISKILEAPVPHTNLNGVGFHRPRETKIVSVGFSYNNAGDEGKLEGNTEAYAYISGSYQCYIRCQVCPKDGEMSFYKNGKLTTSKEFKRGDTVIDQNTISFLDPKTGKYTDVEASERALNKYLESNQDYPRGDAASILEKYNAMQIKVTSQVNRVDFEQKEPDIERKVSIMHKGRILSYNAEKPETTIGKKKIAEGIFDSEGNPIDYSSLNNPSIEKFVKINKIPLPNGNKVFLYAKLSIDAEKVTHQSEPFVKIKGEAQLSKLTWEIMKKNYSDETLAQKLFSRVEHDFKNTKLILGKENEEYKISTPEDFTGPGGIVVVPSGDVSQPKVTSLFDVKELWIKDRVIESLNNR